MAKVRLERRCILKILIAIHNIKTKGDKYLMTVSNKDLFYCYNKNLADYLHEKGFKPLTIAINPRSRSMYSQFPKSKEMDEAIQEYNKIKDKYYQ